MIDFIFYIAIFIMSVVIHEVSHGVMANFLGDPTAKYEGRLTLNPIPHLDPFGSIILPLLLAIPAFFGQPTFIIGWAKPVPYNPYNLKNQKWGPALVGAAGPLANIIIAALFALLARLIPYAPDSLIIIVGNIIFLNLLLAVFNFVPIPPLDGSKVLFAIIPQSWHRLENFLEQYGFIILLVFIFTLWRYFIPIILFLFRLFVGA